ncbi:unnamed protein product [Merluccius merluccius]
MKVPWEQKDHRVDRVNSGLQDFQDNQVYQDKVANQDQEVCQVLWDLKANMVTMALLVSLEMGDYLVKKGKEDNLEKEVSRDQRGFQDLQGQGDQSVLQEFRA